MCGCRSPRVSMDRRALRSLRRRVRRGRWPGPGRRRGGHGALLTRRRNDRARAVHRHHGLADAERHPSRRDPDAGEPVVRPLLRHAVGRPRFLGPKRPPHPRQRQPRPGVGPVRVRPRDRGRPGRLPPALRAPAAVPGRERRLHQRHQPRLGTPAPVLGQREHGRLRAGPPGGRRRLELRDDDGLLHPVRARPSITRWPTPSPSATPTTAPCSVRPTRTGSWRCRAPSTRPARTADRFS